MELVFTGERDLAATLQDVHVAMFLSRAESGTNLFATQALAMGVPTIISNNTGHQDLVDLNLPLCYSVSQNQLRSPDGEMGDWGESDVDAVVQQLSRIYQVIGAELF